MAKKKAPSGQRWPRNISVNMGRVRFRKSIPPDLAIAYGKDVFQEYLPLATSASFEEAYEAAKPARVRYDALLKSLKNSSIDAFAENELEALAANYLKKANLKPGDLALHNIGPAFITRHGLEGVESSLGRKLNTDDLKLLFFPNLLNPIIRSREKTASFQKLRKELGLSETGLFSGDSKPTPTIQELAQYRAAEIATSMKSKQPKTLSWWWNDYLNHRGLKDPDDRDTKRIQGYWDRFILLAGDHIVTEDTQQIIDDALEEQVEYRIKEVAVSTAKRELSEVMAALNRMARKQRPRWPPFIVPETPRHNEKERAPLSVADQITLVTHCLENPTDWVSAVHLLELQGGMMAQEIRTLKPEDLHLEGNYPHIVVRQGKTVARPRVIPIVLGLEVIKDKISEAIKRLDVKDPSATPRKRLKKMFNGRYSSHCLRHTVRINGTANDVSYLMLQNICGWSDGKTNKHMLNYGKAGIADSSEALRATFQASRQLHQHLMHLETHHHNTSNLVKFSR